MNPFFLLAFAALASSAPIYVSDCDKCVHLAEQILRTPVSTVACLDPICKDIYPLVSDPMFNNFTSEEICAELEYCYEPANEVPVIAPGPVIYVLPQNIDDDILDWIQELAAF